MQGWHGFRTHSSVVVSSLLVLIISSLLLYISCFEGAPTAPPTVANTTDIPLAAVFAAWYGYDAGTGQCAGGLGTTHWNDTPNTAGVIYRPELGYYCSADPTVVAWQLDQIEAAGISTLFVSWWDWGDSNLDGEVEASPHPDAYMNRGIQAVLKDIRDKKRPIKVALIVEPFTLTQAHIDPRDCGSPYPTNDCLWPAQKQTVLDWLWANYYGNADYADLMFRWDGKPLVLAFDPMTVPADDRYTVRLWTGRARSPATEAEGWQWFFSPPQGVAQGMSDDGVAWVYPRFDEVPASQMGADYIFWAPRQIDPLLREGTYEAQWQELAQVRDRVRLVVLYGWNLYGEQAHIEPSRGCPAAVWDRYVARTAAYYGAFVQGLPLPAGDGPAPGCAYLPLVRAQP